MNVKVEINIDISNLSLVESSKLDENSSPSPLEGEEGKERGNRGGKDEKIYQNYY
jgi:hypothetical protein